MNRLDLIRLVLNVSYLATAALIAVSTYWLALSPVILLSLFFNLALFAVGNVSRRGELILYSWVWLAVNLLVGIALYVPKDGYLATITSTLFLFVAIDTLQFLEFVYPLGAPSTPRNYQLGGASWDLLKRHTFTVSLVAVFAGAIVWIGVALISPVVVVSNSVLAVGATVALLLVIISALGYRW